MLVFHWENNTSLQTLSIYVQITFWIDCGKRCAFIVGLCPVLFHTFRHQISYRFSVRFSIPFLLVFGTMGLPLDAKLVPNGGPWRRAGSQNGAKNRPSGAKRLPCSSLRGFFFTDLLPR